MDALELCIRNCVDKDDYMFYTFQVSDHSIRHRVTRDSERLFEMRAILCSPIKVLKMMKLLSPAHLDESKPTWMSPSPVAKPKPDWSSYGVSM